MAQVGECVQDVNIDKHAKKDKQNVEDYIRLFG